MDRVVANEHTIKLVVKNKKIDKDWVWLYGTIGLDLLKDIENTLQDDASREQFIKLLKPIKYCDGKAICDSDTYRKVRLCVRYVEEYKNDFDTSIYIEYKDFILEFTYAIDMRDNDASYKEYHLVHLHQLTESIKLKKQLLGVKELTYNQMTELVRKNKTTIII